MGLSFLEKAGSCRQDRLAAKPIMGLQKAKRRRRGLVARKGLAGGEQEGEAAQGPAIERVGALWDEDGAGIKDENETGDGAGRLASGRCHGPYGTTTEACLRCRGRGREVPDPGQDDLGDDVIVEEGMEAGTDELLEVRNCEQALLCGTEGRRGEDWIAETL